MATPDVRVRLSAEGVAEVVAALKAIQAQSAQTSSKGGAGFLGLNRILGSTASMLRSLGIAFGVHQIIRWIGSSVDAAAATLRLSRQVGATVENLSGLNFVARTTGVSLDQVGDYLSKMNNWIGQVLRNTPAATATLRRLGLTVDDFAGKDAVQILELLANRITALPTVFQQTNVARDIFGRGAADLIPTLQALADEGLEPVKERARELGVLLDTQTAESMRNLKRDLELLKIQTEGVKRQFAAGISPELSQSIQIVTGDIRQGTGAWREFGQGVGIVLKSIVAAVSTAFDFVGTSVGGIITTAISGGKILGLVATGRMAEAKAELEVFGRWYVGELDRLKQRMSGRWDLALGGAPEPGPGKGWWKQTRWEGAADGGWEDEENERAARLQTMQAGIDTEIALVKAAATLRNATEKRAFDQGLIDVTTYYANRLAIAADAYTRERDALLEKRALLDAEPDPVKRDAGQAAIDAELAKNDLEHSGQIAAINGEELTAVRDLGRERLALDRRILEAEGQRHAAAMLAIEAEIAKEKERPLAAGESPEERAARAARLGTALTRGEDFEEARRQAEAALSSLDAARSDIDARMSAGLLSQLTGEQQILEVEKSRLPILAQLAAALEAAAAATGDPEKLAQAQAFSASIRELGYSVEASQDAWTDFVNTVVDSGTDALATFFDTGIKGSENLGDAFRSMVSSIAADVRRLAAELMATGLMKAIIRLAGNAAGGNDIISSDQSMLIGARGGRLRGPGTGTSDSILMRGSRGEFLVREAVVSQPGVLEHLEELNRHGVRRLYSTPMMVQQPIARFASGGLVDIAGGRGERAGEDGRMLIGLEEGLVLRYLESSAGQRTIVKIMGKNRRAVRSVVGS